MKSACSAWGLARETHDLGAARPSVNQTAVASHRSRAGHKVLVVSSDAMVGALIGSLVELARLEPVFPRPGESADEALRRIRPVLLVLLDAGSEVTRSDLFLTRVSRARVPVAVFGSRRAISEHSAWLDARRLRAYALPDQFNGVLELLDRLPANGASRRTAARRALPGAPDTVFHDRRGTEWLVYDRRGTERRKDVVNRRFVSDTGETRHCLLSAAEAADRSVEALAAQLARSVQD